ncbi:unnamed protein product [Mycena citricolor]|uniref:Alpha-type protein kinase domain-containing protein n=2 Tax=Mycena citricolor TaxID=2018698 RepID=A0AAD2Q5D4_9AGAR|nr:unnamed protein product [Mycena citricolor]CAK5278078.1 unnamed protein product [Mycena citricolor]CAK5278528.1 unnamed protein product [Mycena citricolor]CAK5282502.1 unnamed protein product [Mycena citricolor]
MSGSTLFANFTDDSSDQEPVVCQTGARCYTRDRSDLTKGLLILPGQPRFRVENLSAVSGGRLVCAACHAHYARKASSSVRATFRGDLEGEKESIRQRNIQGRVGGPRVSLPNQPISSSGSSSAPINPGQYSSQGYSAAHSQYAAARGAFTKSAYTGMSPQWITLNIGVRYETRGRPTGQVFGVCYGDTIHEGKNVPATITASEIITAVFDNVAPKLRQAIAQETDSQFVFDESNFLVRDTETWINVHAELPGSSVLYERCLKTSKARADKGQLVFQRPRKPFQFALVIDAKEWLRYENYRDARELDTLSIQDNADTVSSALRSHMVQRAPEPSALKLTVLSAAETTKEPSNGCLTRSKTKSKTATASSFSSVRPSRSAPSLQDFTQPDQALPESPLPSSGTREISSQESSSKIATSKKRAASPIDDYHPVDQQRLRKALSIGGSFPNIARALHTTEIIQFFRITGTSDLNNLLANGGQKFVCDIAKAEAGTLSLQPSEKPLGIGSFKSAHSAFLTLSTLPTTPLGALPNQAVAAKRMFKNNKNTVLIRFNPIDEYAHHVSEANLLFWGTTLLSFVYSFVRNYISKHVAPPGDLPIFEVRFVEAGVALVHNAAADGKSSKMMTSLRRSYLIEELIGTGKFVKYINNNSAVPVPSLPEDLKLLASFLCFTQHVQYEHTGRLVFLSDLQGRFIRSGSLFHTNSIQGSGNLLTDPQVMTSPTLERGLFGGGNSGRFFEKFPEQHVCSGYCKFFGLSSLM